MRQILLTITCLILSACGVNAAERNNTANQLSEQGNYEEALKAYQAALVEEPDNALIYLNISEALARTGSTQASADALAQAVQVGDGAVDAAAYYNLGNLYFEQERYSEAVEAYKLSLLLNANQDDTRFNLELALARSNQATPTPAEMRTEPDQQQADATPTPNPAGMSPPTPTPPPPQDPAPPGPSPVMPEEEDSNEPTDRQDMPVMPEQRGTLTVEQAERILDAIELDQEAFGNLIFEEVPESTPPAGKDW